MLRLPCDSTASLDLLWTLLDDTLRELNDNDNDDDDNNQDVTHTHTHTLF
jgi:hypothetical protein